MLRKIRQNVSVEEEAIYGSIEWCLDRVIFNLKVFESYYNQEMCHLRL